MLCRLARRRLIAVSATLFSSLPLAAQYPLSQQQAGTLRLPKPIELRVAQLDGPEEIEDSADGVEAADDDGVAGLPQIPETRVVAPQSGTAGATQAPSVVAPAQSLAPATTDTRATFPNQPLPIDTVVTDTRTVRAGGSVGSSMSVITREAIEASGQTSVAEVLRSVAGVDVLRSGGPGQATSVFIRGANSNHTKVLIDGLPANDPGSPNRAFDFSFLTVDQIQRIEVLRGPQSTLYGSDAMGGVINIITIRGEGPPTAKASVMGGRYGTFRPAASVSGGDDDFYYSVGGSYYDTDGFSAASRPPGNVEDDYYRTGTIAGRFGTNVTSWLNLDLVTRYSDNDTATDGFDFVTGLPTDDNSSLEQDNTFIRGQATAALLNGLWTHTFGAGYTQYDRQSFGFFGGPFYGRSGHLDYQNEAILLEAPGQRLIATSGVAFLEEVALTTTFPPPAFAALSARNRQGNLGGFALLSYDLNDRLFLTGGGRWDDYSRAGNAFTYRFTSRYLLDRQTALHGAIGTGFRAPALAELFGAGGNPNLRSERSKGWEAGLERSFFDNRTTLDVTYFRNDFNDLIQFPFPLFTGQNVGLARTSGVEITSLWRLSQATTSFVNYTYTSTLNRDTGTALLRRPRNKWSFGTSRNFCCNRANLTWSADYVGDRLDIGGLIGDSYWLINLAGSYRASDRWRLFGRIDNLLDEEYEEVVGFRSTDIAGYAGAELTL